MADSFQWGSPPQTWGYGDLAAFTAYLKAHGTSYDAWAANHPDAANILTYNPNAYVPGGSSPAVAAAIQAAGYAPPPEPAPAPPAPETAPYNPNAYVPGGSSPAVAAAIQAAGYANPGPNPVQVPQPADTPATTEPAPTEPAASAPAPGSPTGIPSGVLDHRNLERVWVLAGGPTEHADVAAAIAQAESSGNPTNIDNTAYPDRPGYHTPPKGASEEYSVGLWQINMIAHPGYLLTDLEQPLPNGQAAVAISNGGTDFGPWSTYTDGAYKQFLEGTPPPGGFEATPGTTTVTPAKVPAGAATAWADIIDLAATGVSRHSAAVESAADALTGVFQ